MSGSPLPQDCIVANPDIAGIGVRVAIYAQNFLALIIAFAALGDRYVSWTEMRIVEGLSMSILLTACALLLSAVVQAVKLGMSTYHALVILNLAWMNNTNTFVYAILFRYQGLLQVPSTSPRAHGGEPLPKKKALPLLIIGSLHLSFVGGFGLWFWKTVDSFGISSQCIPDLPVPLVILGRHVPVTSRALRKLSFAIYGVIAVPAVNLIVAVAVIYGSASLCFLVLKHMGWVSKNTAFFGPGYLSLIILAGINVVITIDTETMIHFMRPYVRSGESDWTFGQTLAMFLLIMPLRDILLVLIEEDKQFLTQRERIDRTWKAYEEHKKKRKEIKRGRKEATGGRRNPLSARHRPSSHPIRPARFTRPARATRPAPIHRDHCRPARRDGTRHPIPSAPRTRNTEPTRADVNPPVPTPPSDGKSSSIPHHSHNSHSPSKRQAIPSSSSTSTASTSLSRERSRHSPSPVSRSQVRRKHSRHSSSSSTTPASQSRARTRGSSRSPEPTSRSQARTGHSPSPPIASRSRAITRRSSRSPSSSSSSPPRSPSPSHTHSSRIPPPPPQRPPSPSSTAPEPSTSVASVLYWRTRALPPTPSTTTMNQ